MHLIHMKIWRFLLVMSHYVFTKMIVLVKLIEIHLLSQSYMLKIKD